METLSRDAYNLQEVADRTGLSLATIKREIKAGRLRSKKIGGRRIIPIGWYQEWLTKDDPKPQSGSRPAPAQAKAAGPSAPTEAGGSMYPWQRLRMERRSRTTSTGETKKKL
jgi:excisionase family DNA binding protein